MKYIFLWLLALCCVSAATWAGGNGGRSSQGGRKGERASGSANAAESFFPADNPNIQYMGRFDLSDPKMPRGWAAGVVIRLRFRGDRCRVVLPDQAANEKTHNYVGIAIDGQPAYRVKLSGHTDTLTIAGTGKPDHIVSICKDTEAGNGWLALGGVFAAALLPPPALPVRKIECIGNSITTGTGMDLSETPCGQGEWYDQHNAWMSYGARTARALNAQWHLTAVAGIGLIHSCCKMTITMPEVFDKMDLRDNTGAWDFSRYQPDVVTITLGQNDGVQDSTVFCSAYLQFVGQVRRQYPTAQIVLLTSPMGDAMLTAALKRYLGGVVAAAGRSGDSRVHSYFYSKQYSHGCGGHPDLEEHGQIAGELTAYLKRLMGW